jgi:hypothetical protein
MFKKQLVISTLATIIFFGASGYKIMFIYRIVPLEFINLDKLKKARASHK